MVRFLRFLEIGLPEGGFVPEVEASERSGLVSAGIIFWPVLGRVLDIEGVGNECGVLEEEPLEFGGCGG